MSGEKKMLDYTSPQLYQRNLDKVYVDYIEATQAIEDAEGWKCFLRHWNPSGEVFCDECGEPREPSA